MKTDKRDRLVIAGFVICSGMICVGFGLSAFLEAARHNILVVQVPLGLTIIFAGVGQLIQRSYLKIIEKICGINKTTNQEKEI